jgi:hypothetical protein
MAKDNKDKGPPTGETPFQKFESLVRQVIAVPKSEIDRRDAEWRKKRRGKTGNAS